MSLVESLKLEFFINVYISYFLITDMGLITSDMKNVFYNKNCRQKADISFELLTLATKIFVLKAYCLLFAILNNSSSLFFSFIALR